MAARDRPGRGNHSGHSAPLKLEIRITADP
jgi:hypothetical protein